MKPIALVLVFLVSLHYVALALSRMGVSFWPLLVLAVIDAPICAFLVLNCDNDRG